MKGQKLFRITSFIMIVGGVASAVLGILYAASVIEVETTTLVHVALIVAGILQCVAGYVGVKASGMPSVGKIKASVYTGGATNLIFLATAIYMLVGGDANTLQLVLGLCGTLISLTYVVGVIQFKNALQALMSGE